MTLEKLTSDELDMYGSQYVAFLKTLKPGEGAQASVTEEGVTKITLKRRLERAAARADIEIVFLRSDPNSVVLERVV